MAKEGYEVKWWICPDCKRHIDDDLLPDFVFEDDCPSDDCNRKINEYRPVLVSYTRVH